MCELSCFSHVRLFVTPWTVVHQTPLSVGFPRQEHRSGLPFPSPEDPPRPGIKPASPALAGGFFTTGATWEALAGGFFTTGATWEASNIVEGYVDRGVAW